MPQSGRRLKVQTNALQIAEFVDCDWRVLRDAEEHTVLHCFQARLGYERFEEVHQFQFERIAQNSSL
jgi:hypothetical protein